jgi:hypothetical protein
MPSRKYHLASPVSPVTNDIAAALRDRIARAELQFAAIAPEAAAKPLAPGKWSTQQVVGHLIDSANNNLQRLIRLQLTAQLDFPGYQQDDWVHLQRFDRLPWPEVVALWLALNRDFAHAIQHADAASLTHIWLHDDERLTLSFILVDYIGHLDHHLRQLPGYSAAM